MYAIQHPLDVLISLLYIVFTICVIYPPTEFASAGFTIEQLFESYLGSENVNFIGYHMKRITITLLIHSALPVGYFFILWCRGAESPWLPAASLLSAMVTLTMAYRMVLWWENQNTHIVVRALKPYVTEGSDWRVVAANFNVEFRSVDKVSIQLTATSKLVATATWLVKVTPYNINMVKQDDCALMATGMDTHTLSVSGEDVVQYINIEAVPSRADIPRFSFRISALGMREIAALLARPVRVPDHMELQPTLIERFIAVFRRHVNENPVYYFDHEIEQCIGCMQTEAEVKLNKRCESFIVDRDDQPACQQCNCRALWCCACMARWWAARAEGPTPQWLSGRGTCPVCRAVFCLLDVCPAVKRRVAA